MTSLEDINDPTIAMNTALILFAKNQQGYNAWQNVGNQVVHNAVQNPGVQNGGNQNGLVVVPRIANQNGTSNIVAARAEGTRNRNQVRCYNCRGLGHIARNCTARPRRRDAAYLQTQLLIAQKEEAWIQLQAEEFDFMAAAGDLDEIEEVNANCILMANLQQASTSGTQLDKAPVYDTDGSAEVQHNDNCYDNDIFNMFTQEEQYTDLLEPIPEPQLVPQNDNNVTSVAPSMVQSGGTVETSSAPNEETRAHQETVYRNLIDQVAQVNMVNRNMRATNAELKSELARYKIQEQRIEISQEKYDKLEKCYQKSVYQEQCLTRKINALHLSSAKQITTLNDEISNLNKQLSKEKSTISSLMEEKKRLKHDFKTREDKYLDKEVDLEAKIKELENILLKRDQTQAQLKQQSLYNGNLLLEKHDPPAVYDSEETLKLAQESREKMRFLKKEIKPVNYAKINHLSGVFVPQTTKSKEELFLSNVSNMVTVSKTISIPNEDLSDDTTPSVARKFLNEVKNSLVTLQQAAKFVRDFKSLAKEADESLDKQKSLELEIERLLKASVSHDIMSIVQNSFVDVPLNLQTELDLKEHVSSDTVNSSSTGLVHTARTRLPPPQRCEAILIPVVTMNYRVDSPTSCLNLSVVLRLGLFQAYDREHQASHQLCVEVFGNCSLWERPHCCNSGIWRNTCFIRDLDGVDLLKGNRTINLYTINLYDMASASPICLMARATPKKSWLWHQQLSHLNFDTINDLAKNDLVSGLPKFKYAKEHLCPSCEQGKSKRASHPPKPVPNSKQRLHLLHMDLCGPMRVASINGKQYILVIVDDYSRYTWVHFLRTKDETPEVIKNFLKNIYVRLQAHVIIVRTENGTELKNHALKKYFDSVGITHETSAAKTPHQNGVVERRNCYCVLHSKSFNNSPTFQQDTVRVYSRQKTGYLLPLCFWGSLLSEE
ncbi:retrovirus-related pol polyprotein from transposon TNT 1-94 [Tanacetum coccineum]